MSIHTFVVRNCSLTNPQWFVGLGVHFYRNGKTIKVNQIDDPLLAQHFRTAELAHEFAKKMEQDTNEKWRVMVRPFMKRVINE